MVGATKNPQFQKALRLMKNDICYMEEIKLYVWTVLLHIFLMPYNARPMTLIPHL